MGRGGASRRRRPVPGGLGGCPFHRRAIPEAETRLRSFGGEYRWHLWCARQPLRDQDGKIVQWVGAGMDIEDRKQAEAELERKVAERTAEASEQARRAQAANLAKSDFLAMMSHEIRTPMNVIVGLADLIDEAALPEAQREYVRMLRTAGATLLAVINDVLDLGDVEARRLRMQEVPFDPSEGPRVGDWVAAPAGPGPWAEARMPHGRSTQTRDRRPGSAAPNPDPSHRERHQIHVQGICYGPRGGRPPAGRIGRVYVFRHRYRRRHSARKAQPDLRTQRRPAGPLHRSAASGEADERAHSGRRAKAGRGSAFHFTVTLPVISDAAPADPVESPEHAAPEHTADSAPQNRYSILIVDDSPDNVFVVKEYLKGAPYTIDVAETGVEAIAKVKTGVYDLILMDVQMPDMDGYTATGIIRAWESEQNRAPMPILALTAHALASDTEKSMQAGSTAHLAKPIQRQTLLAALAAHTSDRVPGRIRVIMPDGFEELTPDYLLRRKDELASLRISLEGGDYASIRRAAHDIKGSSASYGFIPLTGAGRKLEQAAAARDVAQMASVLNTLDAYLQAVELIPYPGA